MVLDEATSALDAHAERQVLDALTQRGSDVIIVAITHRPAILDICDHILQLDAGRVTFFGAKERHRHNMLEQR